MGGIISSNKKKSTDFSPEATKAPINLLIAGAPAAGKGTQSEILRDKYRVVHISTGELLRAAVEAKSELGLKVKHYMENALLVPDDLIIDVVCERLNQQDCRENGWLLDGFPRTEAQAKALAKAGLVPDCFIMINVPESFVLERITGRRVDPVTGNTYHIKFNPPPEGEVADRVIQRSDDTEEKIVKRYSDFTANIDAIKSFYQEVTLHVDGTKHKEDVQSQIAVKLNEIQEKKQEGK